MTASERTGVRSPISNRQLALVGGGNALGGGIRPTVLGRPEGGVVDMVEQGLRAECKGSALGKRQVSVIARLNGDAGCWQWSSRTA